MHPFFAAYIWSALIPAMLFGIAASERDQAKTDA